MFQIELQFVFHFQLIIIFFLFLYISTETQSMMSTRSSLEVIKQQRVYRQNVLQKYLLTKNTANQINNKVDKEKNLPGQIQQIRMSSLGQKPQFNRKSLANNIVDNVAWQNNKQLLQKQREPSSQSKKDNQNNHRRSQKKISLALIKILLGQVLVKNNHDSQDKQKQQNCRIKPNQNKENQNRQVKIKNIFFHKKGIIHSQPTRSLQYLNKIIYKKQSNKDLISHGQTQKNKKQHLFSTIIKIGSKNFTQRRSIQLSMMKTAQTQCGTCCKEQITAKINQNNPKLKQTSSNFPISRPSTKYPKIKKANECAMTYLYNLTDISQTSQNKNKSFCQDSTLDPWSTQQIHPDEQKYYEQRQ